MYKTPQKAIYSNETIISYIDQHVILSVLGVDGSILYQSPSVAATMGCTQEELFPMTLTDMVHHDDLQKLMPVLAHYVKNGLYNIKYEFTYRGLHKSGRNVPCKAYASLQKDNEGNTILVVLSIDMTQEIELQTIMEQHRKYLSSIFDASFEMIFLLDRCGTIILCNKQLAAAVNELPEHLVGVNFFSLFDPVTAANRREVLEKVITTKEPQAYSDFRNGRFFEARCYPIMDSNGAIESVAVYAKDVTELKHYQRELEGKNREIFILLMQRLSKQEMDVIKLYADGISSTKEIAYTLGCREESISRCKRHILSKLQLPDNETLTVFSLRYHDLIATWF